MFDSPVHLGDPSKVVLMQYKSEKKDLKTKPTILKKLKKKEYAQSSSQTLDLV